MTRAEGVEGLADQRVPIPGAAAGAGGRGSSRTRRRWQLVARLALAAATGVLLALAFPPFGLWWLAPLAVAAATLQVRDVRPRLAAGIGLVFGTAFFLVLLKWLLVIGWNSWVLLSVIEAAFIALLFAGVCAVARLPWWPLWTACLWVLEELARDRIPFGGFPWGRLAFSAADAPYRGYAAIGGMPLVTFVVALAGAMIAAAAVKLGPEVLHDRHAVGAAGRTAGCSDGMTIVQHLRP